MSPFNYRVLGTIISMKYANSQRLTFLPPMIVAQAIELVTSNR